MSLRWRIAIGFALVALATAAIIALATPPIVSQGFSDLEGDNEGPQATAVTGATLGAETGDSNDDGGPTALPAAITALPGPTRTSAAPAAGGTLQTPGQAQQATIMRILVAAAFAAAGASLLGLVAAGRLVRPLTRLEVAANAVAHGDLSRRSGLSERGDEFGQLGRTFDTMADELQRADETRRRFLQDAAHELKTPLAVIEATSSAILDGVYSPEQRHLLTIRDQSRILARIVDDLRTISLAEGGHLPLVRRPLDIRAVLESVATGFEARAAGASIKLAVEGPAGLIADADQDRLRQMIGALVDNALRHTPDGGTVRLVTTQTAAAGKAGPGGPGAGQNATTGQQGAGKTGVPQASLGASSARPAAGGAPAAKSGIPAMIRISIEDTGPGISAEALPRVFERFFQADESRSRGTGTSGLGLSIVRALADAHGGRSGAENCPDGGARLWIELPAIATPPTTAV